MNFLDKTAKNGLYRPEFEKDNCGFGLIAHMDGQPSHWLVLNAIKSLARMTHRGAIAADGKSGDGCGLLLRKPERFLRETARKAGISLGAEFGVGMVFLNADEALAEAARQEVNKEIEARGLEVSGWREVPVDPDALGEEARASMPKIEQVFITAPVDMDNITLNRNLYVARRRAAMALRDDEAFYISSISADSIIYKGLMMPQYLADFYLDLQDESLESSIAVFHQRFSTNTLPQWRRAQPFRYLAHNGEINTIQGNRNWANARANKFKSDLLPELQELQPLVSGRDSDSASLDNMLEVLLAGGMDIFQAMRMLLPPAWQNSDELDPELRGFLEFSSMHMEPWDGPAGVVLSDGRYAACVLDRNGLRPARYVITKDGHITLASEIGVWDYDTDDVVEKGRLKPGDMLAVDTQTGTLMKPRDVNDMLKSRHPYAKWLWKYSRHLRSGIREITNPAPAFDEETLTTYEKMFNVSYEERDEIIRVLAENGAEAVGSMGDDTPFPVMSRQVRSLYDNFRQHFAQVTNPPIDPLREAIVMSLETCLGREKNPFRETIDHAKRLLVRSPILSQEKFETLLSMSDEGEYEHAIIDLYYDPSQMSLKEAIGNICSESVKAVRDGKVVIVLSDRKLQKDRLPVHALLATGAVHHALIGAGVRCDANLVIETATARDSHHMAVLLGYGATCVYPYLAYQCIGGLIGTGEIGGLDLKHAEMNYRAGINKGLLKILSKMGISTITSYRGAQLFEIVGLHEEVVDLCFKGTTSRVQGTNFMSLQDDARQLAARAFNPRALTEQGGLLKYIHGGEYHAYNPDVVGTLQTAVASGDFKDYKIYADLVDNRPPSMLRDLLSLKPLPSGPIPLEEVESAEAILSRFDSAGMSLGALSPEAHETLAEAMNRLGGRSNSGEGGEDIARYGTLKMSKIKQIASGRFGVTPHYLVNAEVLQIKVAQGAKPGEGGQLPGHKVNEMIARLRHSTPGVSLISPPPHHDIYSIEDLAQLIFDLKQVNPEALVSVKLVAEAGVGTVAAGVAKAYADLITVSGYDGGTGASPLTSVKYAGSPWELGVSETHQVLRANNLREKVRLQADGGLKTGLDVIKAAMLGAESFGFGTGPMIAMGCKFLRICHLNNCATGVATQHKVLRMRHFTGNVEKVMNYMKFIAEDVRIHMASLGVRNFEELIGNTDLLEPMEGQTDKQKGLDFSRVLYNGNDVEALRDAPRFCTFERNEPYDKGELAEQMVAECLPAIENRSGGEFTFDVKNINRSIGARLSGEIAKRYGNHGMEDAPIRVNLRGTSGQSLGVWNAGGLHIYLEGDANDYVGKGMTGGKLVIRPPANAGYSTNESTIIGNTCLYGATGGKLYAAGKAGERFAVRNSGCHAVVEGIGDHGCEYMTGGCVTVLGETGVNFGAGMTGGFAFVLDRNNVFVDRYNNELIDIHRLNGESMHSYRHFLRDVIDEYVQETGSKWAQGLLDDFYVASSKFWLVKPKAASLAELLTTLQKAA